jgi:hypothetical protein
VRKRMAADRLKAEDAKRLKDLERGNATLKRLWADAGPTGTSACSSSRLTSPRATATSSHSTPASAMNA